MDRWERRALLAERKLELLHSAVLQCAVSALGEAQLQSIASGKRHVLGYLSEMVVRLQASSFEVSDAASLQVENRKLSAKVRDLELLMKFQLQSLNDIAKKDEAVVNHKVELRRMQADHADLLVRKETEHKEALDRLNRQIDALRLENKKLHVRSGSGSTSTSSKSSRSLVSTANPKRLPMRSSVSRASLSLPERMPSVSSLSKNISALPSNVGPSVDRVEVSQFAEFLHSFRLYRVLPLNRETGESSDSSAAATLATSMFELDTDTSQGSRVNLVQGKFDQLVDLILISTDCMFSLSSCRLNLQPH